MMLKKIAWSAEAQKILEPALNGDGELIKADVDNGYSELFYIPDFGYLITRIENNSELVLVAIAGRGGHEVTNFIEVLARAKGLKSIRIHSARKGAERYIQKLGFYKSETVFKKEL